MPQRALRGGLVFEDLQGRALQTVGRVYACIKYNLNTIKQSLQQYAVQVSMDSKDNIGVQQNSSSRLHLNQSFKRGLR